GWLVVAVRGRRLGVGSGVWLGKGCGGGGCGACSAALAVAALRLAALRTPRIRRAGDLVRGRGGVRSELWSLVQPLVGHESSLSAGYPRGVGGGNFSRQLSR